MNRFALSAILVVMVGVGLAPGPANGQLDGEIAVFFDAELTQRTKNYSGSIIDTVWIAGQNFPFINVISAEYRIDYSPKLMLLSDIMPPTVAFSNGPGSDSAITIAFKPTALQPGKKFLIQQALVLWTDTLCTAPNVDGPVVLANPQSVFTTPMVGKFINPTTVEEIPAFGARSQFCQFVELDIRPGTCPNHFSEDLWSPSAGAPDWKGGSLPIAILGSPTVDVGLIDPASCRLEGVSPFTAGSIADVATPDNSTSCVCNQSAGDGFDDLMFQFLAEDVAAAIPQANPGDTLTLTLTGSYVDAMPFSANDCVVVIGGGTGVSSPPAESAVVLGGARPNPFNPITRINYSIPSKQRVHLAVFDVRGRLLETLVDGIKGAGDHVVEWNATRLSSGVYFYRLQVGEQSIVRRATLLK